MRERKLNEKIDGNSAYVETDAPLKNPFLRTSTAERHNEGKLKWTLVDFKSLEQMVKVLEFGAEKYDKHNWKKGLPYSEITDSLMRHLVAFINGEDVDPESGLSHIAHVQCNAMFLQHMMENKPEFDDRYTTKK